MEQGKHVIGGALGYYETPHGLPWCHACQQFVHPDTECLGPVEPPCHACGGSCEGRVGS